METSITFDYNSELRLMNVKRTGSATQSDMNGGVQQLVNHPDFPETDFVIMDLTDAKVTVDAETIKKYSQTADQSIYKDRKIKVAIVEPWDLNFGMSKIFSMYSKNSDNIGVVRSRQEAFEWLGLT